MSQTDVFNALAQGLERAGSVATPDEVHGTLTGMLCVDNAARPERAVSDRTVDDRTVTDRTRDDRPDDDASPEMLGAALDALREMILEGLFDPDLSFAPLLPDDQAALETRVEALARWCAGFVYGLSQDGEFDLSRLSAEVREAVGDLTELSRAGLTSEDSDSETAEADYAELVEYTRVAVQMVFLELQPKRQGPATREKLH